MVTTRPYTDLGMTESENVGLVGRSDKHIVLINSNEVPFYHLVHYFTRETMHNEPQVHDLNIAYFLYYTHMYFAWMQVEPNLSVVAVEQGSNHSELYGANMALPIPALTTMYAPGNITKVLAFVRECYEHVREVNHLNKTAHAFVSTLRTSATLEINQKLVEETTKRFREMSEPGAYHLLWEDQTLMVSF
ncbi:unnamed protein product [Echinostoma caproni]|uniref:Glyco_transf_41 domain-containing protein n=1 Tax=Echinostoma caproni TaxID=27848 RepID=A0A183A9J9_9TREM|nr:unnamed protein product [Echinostoma caproni]